MKLMIELDKKTESKLQIQKIGKFDVLEVSKVHEIYYHKMLHDTIWKKDNQFIYILVFLVMNEYIW